MNILILLLAIEVKHLFCDLLQTDFMVQGKSSAKGWIIPTLAHAAWHGFWTGSIMTAYSKSVYVGLICGVVDTATHFTIDRIKSSPFILGKYKADEKYYLIILVADQLAHHANYLLIVLGYEVLK